MRFMVRSVLVLAAVVAIGIQLGRRETERPNEPAAEVALDRLPAAEACLDAGYLCAALAGADSFRVMRWPNRVRSLTVHVPLPDVPDVRRARSLRRAVERGVLRWHERPLRLSVNDRVGGEPDIVVSWVPQLDGSRLGVTRTELAVSGDGVIRFSVPELVFATRHPDSGRPIEPDALELVAVHEMGHALGLPHSDNTNDVMYPEKTARFLTTRDHHTIEALYRLPVGALIVR